MPNNSQITFHWFETSTGGCLGVHRDNYTVLSSTGGEAVIQIISTGQTFNVNPNYTWN